MTKPKPLALQCVIPETGNPIAFAGGAGENGTLRLALYDVSGEQLQELLGLRGKELIIVLQEAD